MTKNRTTAHNRRLAQWRVTWLTEHSTSHQLLWCIDSFELRNPPLRQAPKRYTQFSQNHAQMRIEIFLIFILTFIVSCKTEKVDGIIIGETLLVHQSYTENKELKIIIEKCLNKEEDGFKRLN